MPQIRVINIFEEDKGSFKTTVSNKNFITLVGQTVYVVC